MKIPNSYDDNKFTLRLNTHQAQQVRDLAIERGFPNVSALIRSIIHDYLTDEEGQAVRTHLHKITEEIEALRTSVTTLANERLPTLDSNIESSMRRLAHGIEDVLQTVARTPKHLAETRAQFVQHRADVDAEFLTMLNMLETVLTLLRPVYSTSSLTYDRLPAGEKVPADKEYEMISHDAVSASTRARSDAKGRINAHNFNVTTGADQ
jgi:ElaB/YqjD/DUF883 family membrane-anchored ribosome-binding protein